MNDPVLFKVSRSELPEALRGVQSPLAQRVDRHELKDLARNEVAIGYWNFSNIHFGPPNFVVLNDESPREFLAWLYTYLPAASPLSQWCRLVSVNELDQFLTVRPSNDGLRGFRLAWAGAIVGECIAQTGREDAREALSFVACQATYSYAAARAFAVWGKRYAWSDISRRMEKCHAILAASHRRLAGPAIFGIWEILSSIDLGEGQQAVDAGALSSILAECCLQVNRSGKLDQNSIQLLSAFDSNAIGLGAIDELSAEQRLLLLNATGQRAEEIRQPSSNERRVTEFMMGYIASKIGGGWRNIDAVMEWAKAAPLAPIWFAIIFSLSEKDIYGSTFDGLSRLILRELEAEYHMFERPKFDISADELEVVVTPNTNKKGALRTSHSRFAEIEIFPGVATTVALDVRPEPLPRNTVKSLPYAGAIRPALLEKVNFLAQEVESLKRLLLKSGLSDSDQAVFTEQPNPPVKRSRKPGQKTKQGKFI